MNIINLIRVFRGRQEFSYKVNDNNAHRISVLEKDQTVSYLFSAPVRTKRNGNLVDTSWIHICNGYEFYGTVQDSVIRVNSDSVILKKPMHRYTLTFDNCDDYTNQDDTLLGKKRKITSTTCGVKVEIDSKGGLPIAVTLKTEIPLWGTRINSQFFSLLEREHRPTMTLSVLFFKGKDGKTYPLKLFVNKYDEYTYRLLLEPQEKIDGTVAFEFNLYEGKLFQDTTATKALPDENNAFGSTAFIGRTNVYGTQYLYSKPSFSLIEEYFYVNIKSIKMWLPKLSQVIPSLEAHKMDQSFCSFGSTWRYRVSYLDDQLPIIESTNHIGIDLTSYMCKDERLILSKGILLKAADTATGYGVLATGDSYAYPEILEITTAR